ncbi:MAG TPA: N-acetylmuramoyl-L-alanine amidase [Bryobacteraceae bacterium]|nr:N-acetylmuramoyl-L-alanine amidase [Bryobacteraceae bacterium]
MSLWRNLWTAAIFTLPPALAAPNSGIIQVTGIRSWSRPDSTRVIVETTGPFEYRTDRATNPDRLFIDIPHARPWIAKRRSAIHEIIGDRLVQRVRIAETSPGTTRVVFDLQNPADFKVTRLDAPDRMVVELKPLHHSHQEPESAISSLADPVRAKYTRSFVSPVLSVSLRSQVLIPPGPVTTERNTFYTDPLAPLVASLDHVKPPAALRASTRVIPPVHIAPPTPPETVSSPPTSAMASENASRSLTRALGLKVNRIVIDAGHGGHDDGTIGPHGVLEKDVVLDVALRLTKLIQQRLGTEVVLTRSDDTFIPLQQRTAIANERHADLFLSIHANSSPAREVGGTETFFLNFTNSPDALNLAARENAGADKSVGELKDLIQTITLNDKIEESHTFAQDIQSSMQAQAARSNPAAHNRGVKRAPFVVLIGASMPSVLAEIGFLSNSKDESNLGKPEYRQKVAEALYKGLAEYSQSLSHFDAPRQLAKTEVKTTEKPVPSGLN